MSAFDWLLLVLCIGLFGKEISVKMRVKLDVVARLKYRGKRKKDR